MLILKGFDLTLETLHVEDLELVRFWRNSDHIKKYALNQKEISADDQKKWFEKLKYSEDEYFIISIKDEKCGLIWYNLDHDRVITGFYIYKQERQNSLTPFKIVTIFHNYLFNEKKFDQIFCKIQPDNTRAIRFNLSLGYELQDNFHDYGLYRLLKNNYENTNRKIEKLFK
jgi:RimJ/RimL family protein N-acetyltransferase